MAIEDIFRALEEQADAECRDILDNAKAQAAAVMAEAKEEAAAIKRRYLEQAEASVKSKTMQMVNAAKLENRRRTAALKEQAIGAVFDNAGQKLGKLRGDAAYPAVFRGLLDEALSGVTGDVEIHCAPSDRALAEEALGSSGLTYEFKDLDTSGGVVVVYGDGRIYRRNTLEDRLGKVRQRSQATVSDILFS